MFEKWGLDDTVLAAIKKHAETDYPKECCGLIFRNNQKKTYSRIAACRNIQDDYHAKDPGHFPRTSKNAYFLDPKQLLALQKEARARQEEIGIIYHSHIDVSDQFSEEDFRMAVYEGEPVYPGVNYLIASVKAGKVVSMSLFTWNSSLKQYTLQ
jgi:[CysO sulfur-carrier protein]-S-L-cysteine hydrolase